MPKWLCYQEDTRNFLINVTNEWEWGEGIFEETILGMSHQEKIKLYVMVVNSPDI